METTEKEIKQLEKQVAPYIEQARIKITDDKSLEKASEVRSQLKKYAKEVKEKKESVTKPINQALKNLRTWFAPLENSIDIILTNLDEEMIAYQTNKEAIAQLESEKIANRIGEGKGKYTLETGSKKLSEVDTPEKIVKTESGGTQFIAVPCFEVVDLKDLPLEYHLPNEVKIRAAMKAGLALKGVKYWTEQRPRNI